MPTISPFQRCEASTPLNMDWSITMFDKPLQYLVRDMVRSSMWEVSTTGVILGWHPANERRRYKVTPPLIGWAQT